jgi:hypothetical protein
VLGTFIAPPAFFSFDAAGIDPEIGTRSFTGIFATHRHGLSPLTYTFSRFSVVAETSPPPPEHHLHPNVFPGFDAHLDGLGAGRPTLRDRTARPSSRDHVERSEAGRFRPDHHDRITRSSASSALWPRCSA